MKKTLFLILALAVILTCTPYGSVLAQMANELTDTKIYVRITKPFVVGEDLNTTAEFVDLPQAAIDFGLQGMQLNGQIETKTEKDTSVTGYIKWNSLSSTGSQQIQKTLKSPLRSEFSAEALELVGVENKLEAVGDLEQLATKIVELDKSVKEAEAAVKEKETNNSSTVAGLSPSSGTPSSEITTPTSALAIGADLQSTTYEECDPFIDEGGLTVFKQRKKTVTGESGKIYEAGICENYAKLADIQKKPGECGLQWLFADNATAEMEQWFFIDPVSGKETNVGECRATGTEYPIQSYCDVGICEDYYDEPNAKVFPQCRQGALIGGTIMYGTECQPQSSTEYNVLTEYVYVDGSNSTIIATEDDYDNNISYPLLDKYYMHPSNGKTFVARSVRSTTESYPHKHNTDLCNWTMDDKNLSAQQFANTYIDTAKDLKILQDCAPLGAPVPYAFLELADNATVFETDNQTFDEDWTQSFTPPAGVLKIKVNVVAGGHHGEFATGIVGHPATTWGPGGQGGAAGQQRLNVNLTIAENETIPLYVGFPGKAWKTGGFPNCSDRNYANGSASQFGKDSSSFAPIITKYNAYYANANSGSVGGNGQSGFTEVENYPNARNGASPNLPEGGTGGFGYGAGGGGGGGWSIGFTPDCYNRHLSFGGRGAPGVIVVTFKVKRYLRPDGSIFQLPYNGD